ncbi:sensor histidine kinase [uncultured Tenacibaculum sp.]|uniref:sensor histidine kinase n=1 Tax=uncultured Tenacibaculum sp. TaxID=174713 RepID=UPI002613011D|nr:sensor histidine kinase [uncultured Tenacibaculum sp.]
MRVFKKILFLFLLSLSVFITAQQPVFTQLTEKDGLPDIEFYNIVEDNKGFIWLAADKGLFRYDGKKFKNYTHPDKRGLSVFGVKLDDQGRVWCNNISGQFFYVENDSLKLFKDVKNEAKGELTNFIFFENKLVIYYYREIILVDLNNSNIVKKINDDNKTISVIKNDRNLSYIIEDHKFSIGVDGESNIEKKFKNKLQSNFFYISWSFIPFRGKNFFLGLEKLATKVNKENNRLVLETQDSLVEIKLPNILKYTPYIDYYIYEDLLWLATENGVFICDYDHLAGEIIIKDHIFKGKGVSKVIKDRNDNYWFTTLRNGVYIVPNIHLNELKFDLTDANITAMSKIGEDKILIGSSQGSLDLVDVNTKKRTKLPTLKKEKVFAIVEISENKAIVGYETYTLIIDVNDFSYEYISNYYLSGVKDFSFVEKNKILVASYNSASELKLSSKEIKSTQLGPLRSYTIHHSKKNDKKYVGYVDGTRVYDDKNKELKILHKDREVFTIDIGETNDGTVWLSTFKKGILGVKENYIYVNYNRNNGLLSNLTREIKGDGDNLWISTTNGVQLLNTKTKKFRNLTRRDGINTYNITDIIPFEKELFFSSNKGVIVVDREKLFKKVNTLEFYFTDVSINDKTRELKEKYDLNSDENKVHFKFQINGFLSEENVQYSYKLSNKKDAGLWNNLDENINQVTFNNLASGTYEFTLKATSIDNPTNEFSRTINFAIALPIYKEWWFILLVFLSGVVFIWYRFYTRLKSIKRRQNVALEKARLQKELVSTKLETLRSQMNPHFTFNALNSIQNLILKNDKQEAYNYLTKFSSLIRENLHLSTQNFVVFEQELSLINRYLELEKLRFKESFRYQIIVGEDVEEVKIPTMIIQPYVENAIKHGLLHKKEGMKKIKIEFYIKEGVLVSKIFDNGIGVKRSKEIQQANGVKRKSFSTKSIQERLLFLRDYYKTDIGVEYPEVEEGTMVIIKIPYLS